MACASLLLALVPAAEKPAADDDDAVSSFEAHDDIVCLDNTG